MTAYADPRLANSARKRGAQEATIPTDTYAAEKTVLRHFFAQLFARRPPSGGQRVHVCDWIIRLYCADEDVTMAELSRQYGCSRQRVQQLLIPALQELGRFPAIQTLPATCRLRTAIARYTA